MIARLFPCALPLLLLPFAVACEHPAAERIRPEVPNAPRPSVSASPDVTEGPPLRRVLHGKLVALERLGVVATLLTPAPIDELMTSDDKLAVLTSGTEIFAFDVATGVRRWQATPRAACLSLRVDDQIVLCARGDGVQAYAASSGASLYEIRRVKPVSEASLIGVHVVLREEAGDVAVFDAKSGVSVSTRPFRTDRLSPSSASITGGPWLAALAPSSFVPEPHGDGICLTSDAGAFVKAGCYRWNLTTLWEVDVPRTINAGDDEAPVPSASLSLRPQVGPCHLVLSTDGKMNGLVIHPQGQYSAFVRWEDGFHDRRAFEASRTYESETGPTRPLTDPIREPPRRCVFPLSSMGEVGIGNGSMRLVDTSRFVNQSGPKFEIHRLEIVEPLLIATGTESGRSIAKVLRVKGAIEVYRDESP